MVWDLKISFCIFHLNEYLHCTICAESDRSGHYTSAGPGKWPSEPHIFAGNPLPECSGSWLDWPYSQMPSPRHLVPAILDGLPAKGVLWNVVVPSESVPQPNVQDSTLLLVRRKFSWFRLGCKLLSLFLSEKKKILFTLEKCQTTYTLKWR